MKYHIFGVLALITLALMLAPSALAAISLTANPASVTLSPGDVYSSGTADITNTGNETVRLTSLNWTSNTTHIIAGFTSSSSIDINAGQTKSVGVLVSLDSTIAPGSYSLRFNGMDNTSATANGVMTINIPGSSSNTGFHFGNGSVINLGGQNQARGQIITGKIHVNNDQNSTLTNFKVQFSGSSSYNFQVTSTVPSTVNPHQQFDILYTITVPDSQDSQREKIGALSYTSDQLSGALDVYMQARSMLTIDDVNFESDSGNDNSINPGDTISVSTKPGDSAAFIVYAKNLFGSADPIDMNNAQITATIYNIDNGDDLTLDSGNFDIRYNDRQKETLNFNIPTQADEDTYRVVIEASAEDDNGATHYASETIYLKVKRQSHDLRLSNVEFTPLSVCKGNTATLSTTTTNYGTSREDYARVEVQGTNNNYAQGQNFAVDNYNSGDNTYTNTFSVSTAGLSAGTYNYQVKVFYAGNNFEDVKQVSLLVQDCGNQNNGGSSGNQTGQPPVIIVQPNQPTGGQTQQGGSTSAPQTAGTNQTLYTILLIVGNLLVVLLIIWVIARLLTK